jgi:tetratricopeptide (TPR) repeat protein
LVDIRIDLCLALYNNADGAGAVAMGREAVAEGEALLAATQATDDDRDEAARAHYTLAHYIGLVGRLGEAIAEEQKSIAIEEPLVARNPKKNYVTHLTSMCADAASYYSKSKDWAAVIGYGAKVMRYVDVQHAITSGDAGQLVALDSVLTFVGQAYAGQGDHPHALETYRRMADIREQFAALDRSHYTRLYDYTIALMNLATEFRNAGDRQGALDTCRRARTALDTYDGSETVAVGHREHLGGGYLNLSAQLAAMNEDTDALATARIARQLYEGLYKTNPNNSFIAATLADTRQALASALVRSGDDKGAVEGYRGALELQLTTAAASPSAGPLIQAAILQRRIAGLEARMGDRPSAERDFRKAIEFNLQALARSEKSWSADRKNTAPLQLIISEERRHAEILERLGQPEEALGIWSKALEHARLLTAADLKNSTYKDQLRATTAAVERFEWEKSGSRDATPANVRSDVARAYLDVGERWDYDGDLERTRAAASKALEMYEALLRDDPEDADSQHGIASSLECLANGNIVMARRTSGQERRRNLQQARDYLTRANTLIKEHQMNASSVIKPGQIAVELATVEAWLQELPQVSAAH